MLDRDLGSSTHARLRGLLAAAACIAAMSFAQGCGSPLQTPRLLVKLPDYCPTPDGMAIAPDGRLVVACPNFADQSRSGCLIKIDRRGNVRKWVDVPKLEVTGVACPMGICFGADGDLYVVDNQGWTGSEKGRMTARSTVASSDRRSPSASPVTVGHSRCSSGRSSRSTAPMPPAA